MSKFSKKSLISTLNYTLLGTTTPSIMIKNYHFLLFLLDFLRTRSALMIQKMIVYSHSHFSNSTSRNYLIMDQKEYHMIKCYWTHSKISKGYFKKNAMINLIILKSTATK